MHVDSEEGLLGAPDRLPLSGKRLAAVVPDRVGWINATRVELKRRAVENSIDIAGTSLVGLDELNNVRAVEVRLTNVTTGLATVNVVVGHNLSPLIHDTAGRFNTIGKSSEGLVSRHDTIVGSAAVVLDLLEEDQVRSAQLLDDLSNNKRQVSRLGVQVLSVVVSDGDALAGPLAGETDGRVLRVRSLADFNGSKRKDTVETKGVCHNARDLANKVTELGVVGVLCTVQR